MRPFAPKPHVTFIRLSADGYARVPGVVVKVQYERERDEFGFPVRVELPAEAVDASADNVPDHHHALSSYYRVQLPPNRDWDALLEQIAQYRRDRMERPLQDPVPQLPQQILQLAQK